ncbi:PAS domain-containing hybrid sensor histidine kinase/response regulator [Altererythrobacter lutimaris]|uniref:histidine kinase n=1 Tax=Altererythrobacter lutimaris TaxID=2743979 RepID=A0A850H9Z5_9SPHN|nr:PAS domain-containing hybrid sensor histidine kinase/response regulator [Altererythrobacter lutimaris]NVE95987.1 response regulator [Altererythrobacter lutimaris]
MATFWRNFWQQFSPTISIVLILGAVALSIVLLLNRGMLWDIAIPLTALSVSSVLLLFLVRESTSHRHFQQQLSDCEAQIRAGEEKNRWLKLTEANAHVGHWRLNLLTNEVYWSDETFRIHGLSGTTPPPLDDAIRFYHPDDRALVENAVESARTTGEPFSFRARLMRQDGDIRHVESVAMLEYDEAGQPAMLFGVLADRTAEEAMQRDLREARDDARAMAAAKSAFLAKMSHEIRNPMNGVLGFAELLLTSDLSDSQRRHAELIAESGRNLQTLLGDILDLSKVEAGRLQIHPKPINLSELLQSAVSLAEPIAREKSLSLSYRLDPALPRVIDIDPIRLRQILTNLLSNALRYTDRGSIVLSAEAVEAQLVITVSDTGIGIDPEAHERIFDPFAMVDPKDYDDRGGTGLGLPICRQLAGLMGGTITVESAIGQGSRFVLTLPLVAANRSYCALPGGDKTGDRKRGWNGAPILLAEDFDINRELVMEMARRLDLEMDTACDGAEAVAMVRAADKAGHPYSLVLMDLQMPVMDGFAATRVIRESGFDATSLPIVALTANAYAEDIAACKQAGMQEHLAKPLSFEAFREVLEQWLPGDNAKAA